MSTAIIIPCYNAAAYLSKTVESVRAQTEADWSVILVDDGSTDETLHLATSLSNQDSRIQVVQRSNGHVARARNTGYEAVKGNPDFLMFLDQDDILEPDAISTLKSALESNPGSPAAHGLARKIDGSGAEIGSGTTSIQNYNRYKLQNGATTTAARHEPTTRLMIVCNNFICTPGVALLRTASCRMLADRDGHLFDPEAVPLDDWDFWLRLSRLGDLAFTDRVTLRWRRHDAAGSTNTAAMRGAEMRIRRNLTTDTTLDSDASSAAGSLFRKLLKTNTRRLSKDSFKCAREALSQGNIGAAAEQTGSAIAHYLRYLGVSSAASDKS